ncbi:MAG TPA: PepSY-like domain-containing protein [Ferruginibacter sp.]|nr:PepSY-like domain-containing protein [Ferruginibacter sp.]
MKIFFPVLAASLVLMASCNNEKKVESTTEVSSDVPITTVAKASETEGKTTVITTAEVPDTVRVSFTKKYPAIEKVEWVKYEPIASDDLDMDDTYYYVRYNNSGTDYTSWYNNQGEWVKTSTRITGNANLPDAVNKTINEQYAGYTIVEIDKENDKNMDMYEIELKNGDAKTKVKILPDGTVFKRKDK